MGERIAVLSTSYPADRGDAAGHFVESEARALASQGHEVTVFAAGAPGVELGRPRVVRLADGGATGWPGLSTRLRENPARVFGLMRWAASARAEIQRRGPFDRLIAHFLVPAGFPIASSVGGRAAPALEVVVHGSDARIVARLPATLRRAVVASLLARGARFRCVSGELAGLVEALAGRSLGDAIYVAPLALDVSGAPSRARARSFLGVRADARLVVVVGRLIEQKRVEIALRAARLVPGAEIVVAGDGPLADELAQRFPEARFLGRLPRDATLAWIAAADVLLAASREEGAPTAVREARALGVPVVTTAAGDLLRWAERDPELWIVR